jgi:hypothetical protein
MKIEVKSTDSELLLTSKGGKTRLNITNKTSETIDNENIKIIIEKPVYINVSINHTRVTQENDNKKIFEPLFDLGKEVSRDYSIQINSVKAIKN